MAVKFEHEEDEEGWCSFCEGKAARGVRVRREAATGGAPQLGAKFDRGEDVGEREGKQDFYYRVGTCCIARMVEALEKKS